MIRQGGGGLCDVSVLEFASSVDCIWGRFSPRLLSASLPSLRWRYSTLCLLVNDVPVRLIFVEAQFGNDPVLMMEALCHCTEQQWKSLLCNRRNDIFLSVGAAACRIFIVWESTFNYLYSDWESSNSLSKTIKPGFVLSLSCFTASLTCGCRSRSPFTIFTPIALVR